jgi:hypothetical protein
MASLSPDQNLCIVFYLKGTLHYNVHIPLRSKSTVNATAGCNPIKRQGSSLQEAVHRTLVTVCNKFQLVWCSQSVVNYS